LTSKDPGGYWLTIKIYNKPKGLLDDFLPGTIDGRNVLIPTMLSLLHLLEAPLEPLEGNPKLELAVFQVNYEVRSLVVYGAKLGRELIMHWGSSK